MSAAHVTDEVRLLTKRVRAEGANIWLYVGVLLRDDVASDNASTLETRKWTPISGGACSSCRLFASCSPTPLSAGVGTLEVPDAAGTGLVRFTGHALFINVLCGPWPRSECIYPCLFVLIFLCSLPAGALVAVDVVVVVMVFHAGLS